MSLNAIVDGARTLVYYQRLQQVLANNLANVTTDGFKATLLSMQRLGPTGAPVPIASLDLAQGPLEATGRPLDLALEGPGFFIVRTADGERLTRAASLRLAPAGQLVDVHGDPVLGTDGPLVIHGEAIDVDPDGAVHLDGQTVGHLRLATVADPTTLRQEPEGRFVATAGTIAADPRTTTVRQGVIETSNAEAINATIELLTIQREFEATLNSMRTIDDALGTATNDIGRPAF